MHRKERIISFIRGRLNSNKGWNKVGFLSCKIYMGKRVGKNEKKSLRHMIGGNVVNSFFCNFIKGEMKIKSIKILKTSYLVLIPNQVGQL